MGFDSLFFARVSELEKDARKQRQELEFIWQPEFEGVDGPEKSRQKGMFTHITHEMYQGGCGIDMWIYQ